MAFTAADVKNLREMTGVGMMDCKKALTETDGDMDKAVEYLREKGLAKAAKKAGRIAAEGVSYALVENGVGALVEVNCETDFCAKSDLFVAFVKDIAKVIANELKKAGVDMQIVLVTKFDWKAGYNGFLAGFAAEFDPDGVYKDFVTGASDNTMAYSNPKVDELLKKGRATEDPAQRKAIYGQFEEAYAERPGHLLVAYLNGNYVSIAGLKGLDTARVLGHHAVGVMWNIEDWTLNR